MLPLPSMGNRSIVGRMTERSRDTDLSCVTGVFTLPLAFPHGKSADFESFKSDDALKNVSMLFALACERHRWIVDQVTVPEVRRVSFVNDLTATGYACGYQCIIEPDGWTHMLRKGQLHAYEKHLLAIAQSLGNTITSIPLLRGHVTSRVRTKMLTTKDLSW